MSSKNNISRKDNIYQKKVQIAVVREKSNYGDRLYGSGKVYGEHSFNHNPLLRKNSKLYKRGYKEIGDELICVDREYIKVFIGRRSPTHRDIIVKSSNGIGLAKYDPIIKELTITKKKTSTTKTLKSVE